MRIKLYKAVSTNSFWGDEIYIIAGSVEEAFYKFNKEYNEKMSDIGMKEINIIL